MFRVWFLIVFCLLTIGCAGRRDDLAAVREILSLAKEDKVQGQMRVTMNGTVEAGLKECVYLSSPGSHLDADLKFRFRDVDEPESKQQ